MAKTLQLPSNPSPEQFEKLKKPLVKRILEDFYTDGVDDLTVELGTDGAIATGKFLDRRTGESNRVFEYTLKEQGGQVVLDYRPLSGDFNEPDEWEDDEDVLTRGIRNRHAVTLSFAEGADVDEDWITTYQEECDRRLADFVEELGLEDLLGEDEPAWAR